MELVVFLSTLLALAFAALRWGVSSVEDLDNVEWQRRRQWRGYSGGP